MERNVSIDEYDQAQLKAVKQLHTRQKKGPVPGLSRLVDQLSNAATTTQVDQTFNDWDQGKRVQLPQPFIQPSDDGY